MNGATSRPHRRSPAECAVKQTRRRTLAEFDPANNAGWPLYCVFAVAVVLSHALALGDFDESPRFAWSNYSVSFGTLGVAGFFVLGGFLSVPASNANLGWRGS